MLTEKAGNITTYGAYYATLMAFLIASFFPEYRIWGFNWWAYYPDWVRWGLFGLGVLAPAVLRLILNRTDAISGEDEPARDRGFILIAVAVTILFGCLSYFLRAQTHFLGDGYTLLSSLATDQPIAMKMRQYGESLLHIWQKNLIGGDGQSAALLSYQIISIAGGLIFVTAVALFSRALFRRTANRMLFLLGVCSGGYMLLFFGYVENYSLFVPTVLIYTLVGLLVCQRRVSGWWLLPPLVAAVFFHVLGVTLIPSAIYAIVAPTRFGRRIARIDPKTRWLLTFLGLTGAAVVFYHYYTTNLFFQFAFVPLFENQFTVGGYTMFSWKHLVDYLNLLLLLLPGLPVMATLLFLNPVRRLLQQRHYVYLCILLLSVLGTVFAFDPKLGMPRDWDLFSFAGIPLTIACYYVVAENRWSTRARPVAVLSILLSLAILIPRAVGQSYSTAGLEHFKGYLMLDIAKGRNSWTHLKTYYQNRGDTISADASDAQWKSLHPDVLMLESARRLFPGQGRVREATALGHDIIDLAPTSADGYAVLGVCYINQRKYDSALTYLKILDALRPNNSDVLNNLGHTYYQLRDYARAEAALLRSVYLNGTSVAPVTNLARLYRDQGRLEQYEKYLALAASKEDVPPYVVKEMADHYLRLRAYAKSADAYRRALELGLDSGYVRQRIQECPALGEYIE